MTTANQADRGANSITTQNNINPHKQENNCDNQVGKNSNLSMEESFQEGETIMWIKKLLKEFKE